MSVLFSLKTEPTPIIQQLLVYGDVRQQPVVADSIKGSRNMTPGSSTGELPKENMDFTQQICGEWAEVVNRRQLEPFASART